ncbi:MAG: hypothetical protein CSA76_00945 [Spirochaetales bacterium]|nr:MAG: hypothetical protein CSA76_00945 [Spirochaetales bacterium]
MFIKAEIWTVGRTGEGVAVLLRFPGSARCIPVPIDAAEAQSILLSVAGIEEDPPGWTEMLTSFGKSVGVRPNSVEIFRGASPGTYQALIHFSENAPENPKGFSLKAKAPEALSLAVRSGAAIFIDEVIRREDAITVTLSETDPPFSLQLTRLKAELDKKVAAEEYEEAAGLRDRIKLIEERMRSAEK